MLKKNKILIIILLLCVIIGVIMTPPIEKAKGQEEQETIVTLYSADNRTINVYQSEVEAYLHVGWYTQPVTLLYALDGRTQYTLYSEVDMYLQLGWYTEPMVKMYSAKNEEIYVAKSQIEVYKKVGWFLTQTEAKNSVVNYNDMMLLARVIHAEAAPHNYTDKCYVGAVVMNRLASGKWGRTILSVISARGQYSSYGNKKFNSQPPVDCIAIAKALLQGERYGMPSNVIFQSGGPQGRGIWKIVYNGAGYYNHYYCY